MDSKKKQPISPMAEVLKTIMQSMNSFVKMAETGDEVELNGQKLTPDQKKEYHLQMTKLGIDKKINEVKKANVQFQEFLKKKK